MEYLGENHFLSLSRPDILVGVPEGVPDTTTLAAHDFDVDTRTGFMPPQSPTRRLPHLWCQWEDILEDAISQGLQLGDRIDLSDSDRKKSESWRYRVRNLPVLPIVELTKAEVLLRRGHQVLAWIMHFYIHSLPPFEPVLIPPPISLPLLQISAQLQLPPLLTYSDNVLYNWHLDADDPDALPSQSTIRCHTTFTSTSDEEEFYLVSARIELAAVDALDLMRSTMDEAFVGDDIANRRITEYLHQLADIIRHIKLMLLEVKTKCDPDVFYHQIRPWLRGQDSQSGRKWIFEGIDQDPSLVELVELSGPSAGQSSLLQALDIFLGVNQYIPLEEGKDFTEESNPYREQASILKRMRLYMPRHHRAFLTHLENNPRPLRQLVISASSVAADSNKDGKSLLNAYNDAVLSLKELRDSHLIIVALFIIGPARRNGLNLNSDHVDFAGDGKVPLKGTGGTDMVRFLKGVRDQTGEALMDST
ncbi:Indoleamine 2,3-dioxygenase [Phlegmacium glaucopus]|nr:Indoleamine 2,3-dioxygenase [Phlegmacium glaucopus]KAF8809722.1 Indoleamine 2,3-dioxygenase [Phlegmacium glaucopus]